MNTHEYARQLVCAMNRFESIRFLSMPTPAWPRWARRDVDLLEAALVPFAITPLELLELREENARLKERLHKREFRNYVRKEAARLNYRMMGENVTLKRRVARLEKKLKNPSSG